MKRLLPLLLLTVACGRGAHDPLDGGANLDAGPDAGLTTFLALDRDFQSYKDWELFVVPDANTGLGDRRIYLNHRPEHGATAFPVGTIIVKEENDAASITGITVHAMVKRGEPFNASGARGWEWFELAQLDAGGVTVAWRGITPPDGGGYSGRIGGTCNDCHGHAEPNDFVQSPPLQLTNF